MEFDKFHYVIQLVNQLTGSLGSLAHQQPARKLDSVMEFGLKGNSYITLAVQFKYEICRVLLYATSTIIKTGSVSFS